MSVMLLCGCSTTPQPQPWTLPTPDPWFAKPASRRVVIMAEFAIDSSESMPMCEARLLTELRRHHIANSIQGELFHVMIVPCK